MKLETRVQKMFTEIRSHRWRAVATVGDRSLRRKVRPSLEHEVRAAVQALHPSEVLTHLSWDEEAARSDIVLAIEQALWRRISGCVCDRLRPELVVRIVDAGGEDVIESVDEDDALAFA